MQDEEYDFLLPMSRLVGLDMAVSNICAAMEADNVLLRKRGPLGFISHDAAATKDSVAGYIPMNSDDVADIQKALRMYGLSWDQFQHAITKQPVKWNPMSFNSAELQTKETVIAGTKAICQRFGYDYVLYEAGSATYANQDGAHKSLYQNVIMPTACKDMSKYNKFFKATENQAKITLCFDDVPILQEDEMKKGQAAKAWDDALLIEYNNNLITRNQWLTARGYDTVADGDKYKKDEVSPTPAPPDPMPLPTP